MVDPKLLEESGMDPALAQTHQFYEGAGCIECGGSGFKGRTAICELLDLSDRIREMILARRPAVRVKKAAHEEGMRFLRESAIRESPQGHDHVARKSTRSRSWSSAPIAGKPMSILTSWLASPPPDAALRAGARLGVGGRGLGAGQRTPPCRASPSSRCRPAPWCRR